MLPDVYSWFKIHETAYIKYKKRSDTTHCIKYIVISTSRNRTWLGRNNVRYPASWIRVQSIPWSDDSDDFSTFIWSDTAAVETLPHPGQKNDISEYMHQICLLFW
jgi:hypothetical protein